MASRRELLNLGVASGVLAATGGLAALFRETRPPAAYAAAPATGAAPSPAVPPFSVPLTVPPTLRPVRRSARADYYEVAMRPGRAGILPGRHTDVLTYDGGFPGPTIRARSGRTVVVRQRNLLREPVSVHLHGAATAEADDGSPMNTIAPGASRTYTYANEQSNATLWMHDHAHHLEAEHLYRGLSSLYLLTDRTEERLALPAGRYDIPLMLRDARFDENGQLVYDMDDAAGRDTILVNGRPWPRLAVQARKYRFRLVNTSNMRIFVLGLADGGEIVVVGGDGGLLAQPVAAPVLVLSPGERLDVVIDFSRYAAGTQVVLTNYVGPGPMDRVGQIMRFDVGERAPDRSAVPATLATLAAPAAPTVRRDVELRMDEPGAGVGAYVNGKSFDPARIDTEIRWGTTEEWTVRNANVTIPHNFHMHLVRFRIVERDGAPVPPVESGWKDTVLLWPGETVKLVATFDSYRGVFPYHCHMVDHSAMGMMAQMRIS